MCPEENLEDIKKSCKVLFYVLVVNAVILVVIQVLVFFSTFSFYENMLKMMPGESPLRLELEEYMRITSILQFPIALIYTSFPILTYFKLRRTCKTGRWSDIRAWFRLVGIFYLISAFGVFFFMILMPFFGGFLNLSFPFLATGIILLCSLKYIK